MRMPLANHLLKRHFLRNEILIVHVCCQSTQGGRIEGVGGYI